MSLMNPGIDVQCDDCFTWKHLNQSKPSLARRELRAQGWIARNENTGHMRDYCPACRDKHLPQNLKRNTHV